MIRIIIVAFFRNYLGRQFYERQNGQFRLIILSMLRIEGLPQYDETDTRWIAIYWKEARISGIMEI
jgi:hypothetical protein